MGNLSAHFSRSEFACTCGCGFDTVDHELITVLEDVRDHFDAPVFINSGARCRARNVHVKGSFGSLHLVGKAADIRLEGVDTEVVHEYLNRKYPGRYGIGFYPGRVHIDVRPDQARWLGI